MILLVDGNLYGLRSVGRMSKFYYRDDRGVSGLARDKNAVERIPADFQPELMSVRWRFVHLLRSYPIQYTVLFASHGIQAQRSSSQSFVEIDNLSGQSVHSSKEKLPSQLSP